ncbi:hypothetical protein [Paraburkholderia heleia]|uniref:hypothetical protein n=1 Tax=Paraburkholderia heleia TaxID=634127 RepID=UPI0031DEE160
MTALSLRTLLPPTLANTRPQPGRSLTPQAEEAFVFQMPMISSPDPRHFKSTDGTEIFYKVWGPARLSFSPSPDP